MYCLTLWRILAPKIRWWVLCLPIYMFVLYSALLGYIALGIFGPFALASSQISAPSTPTTALESYVHLQWQTLDNEQFPAIFAISQDSHGFIWLATYDGLVKFDGVDFLKVLSNVDHVDFQKYISSIQITATDEIWFVPLNSGLVRLKNSVLDHFTVNDGLLCDSIDQITLSPNQQLWYGCNAGIGFFDGSQFVTRHAHDGSEITSLLVETDNDYWYGTGKGNLYHIVDQKTQHWGSEAGLASSNVQSIYRLNQHQLLIGVRDNGIYMLSDLQLSRSARFDAANTMSIDAIITDQQGAVWVGSNKGILRFADDGMAIKQLDHLTIAGARTKALFVDHQNNIWAGFYAKGLHQLLQPKITVISQANDIFYAVRTVTEYQGSYWIGTDNGGLTMHDPHGNQHQLTTKDGLPSNTIHALMPDDQGNLWIGSAKGVSQYHQSASGAPLITNYDVLTINLSNWVTSFYQSKDGRIWVGTDNGLATIEDQTLINHSNDLDPAMRKIRWIDQSQTGVMWIGTSRGVLFQQDGRWQSPSQPQLSTRAWRSFHQDVDGGMWFGSQQGDGLLWLKDGKAHPFTSADGLFDNNMWAIAEDPMGILWMISDKGISGVKRQDLEQYAMKKKENQMAPTTLNVTTIGHYEGLNFSECNGASPGFTHTAAGKIIFPCMVGLVELDPTRLTTTNQSPHNHIDYLAIGDQKQWYPHDIALEASARDMSIKYTAVGFDNPDKIQFKYRLSGYKAEWEEVQNRRFVSFTNLKAGDYLFEVNSRFYNGPWGEKPAKLAFTIKPFFYESHWFLLLMLIIGLATGYGLYQYRLQRVLNHHRAIDDAKIEYLSSLVSNIAHNLNTPLGIAITGASITPRHLAEISAMTRTNKLSKVKLQQLCDNIETANQLVSTNLTKASETIDLFKQLNIENYNEDRQPIDIAQLIRELQIDFSYRYPKRRISWQIDQPPDLTVTSYRQVLAQIFNILVDNTLCHGYELDQCAQINIAFKVQRKQLSIRYQDFGKGIPTEEQARLFTPFNLDLTNQQRIGLSMNVVHNLVTHKLLGQITLEHTSPPGIGFLIRFGW